MKAVSLRWVVLSHLVIFLASGSPANAEPNIAFVEYQVIAPMPKSGRFEFNVLMKNTGDQAGNLQFLITDSDDRCTGSVEGKDLAAPFAANEIRLVRLNVVNAIIPSSCYLTALSKVGGTVRSSNYKQIRFYQAVFTLASGALLAFASIFSLAVAIASLSSVRRKFGVSQLLDAPLGAPIWDLSRSWVSNLTLITGAVSGWLSLGALPEMTIFISKSGYVFLALILSLTALISPFFFLSFRKRSSDEGEQMVGSLRTFLMSIMGTYFAAIGQILILALLLAELTRPVGMHILLVLSELGLASVILMLTLYTRLMVSWTLENAINAFKNKNHDLAPGRIPNWSLL